jgi:hypothetical protein
VTLEARLLRLAYKDNLSHALFYHLKHSGPV